MKVCGLTRVDEALACVEAGADWIGLNFHPASHRRIAPALAAEIVAALPPRARVAGLFVNVPVSEILAIAGEVGLSAIQLHGTEPASDIDRLAPLDVIRAFRIGSEAAITAMGAHLAGATRPPFAVLVDADVAGFAGGTGHSIADDLLGRLPPLHHLILAGGLTPENVAGRTARVGPWMVDVASGVESSPGRKDPAKVRAFVRAARGLAP